MSISISLGDLKAHPGLTLYDASFIVQDSMQDGVQDRVQGSAALWLEAAPLKRLAVAAPLAHPVLKTFEGSAEPFRDGLTLKRCPLNHANARALRLALANLTPALLGLRTSAGFGDRLGVATPGHVRALMEVGGEIAPIFVQQSIREMTRTRRSPEDVMRDATFGAFEAGWRGSVGADADHLKTTEDIDACVQAGYSFYTIDPGAHVESEADGADQAVLEERANTLPWDVLEGSLSDLKRRYVGKRYDLGDHPLILDEEAVLCAVVKYGRAVAHVVTLYRHLAGRGVPFELEVSVDETETPTSHAEHFYVASELTRLGVRFVSLAPRYVGRFEKGIDYLGNLAELTTDLAGHAAIAQMMGPYKLSLHSGSDKFSVYPLIYEATRGVVHLKTAGTSYLEALRVIACHEPKLFREIASVARERYAQDKASYHVSGELANVPEIASLDDAALPGLLEHNDARQVLHVTFGSVLDRFKPELMRALETHEEAHYDTVARHFVRHLMPFAQGQFAQGQGGA